MQGSKTTGKLTYADYAELPSDGKRHEIVDGKHHVSPAPYTIHQSLLQRLFVQLDAQVERVGRGRVFIAPVDVVLSPNDVVQPDLVVITEQRRSIVTERNVQGAPDLVVEVLSPSTRHFDLGDKKCLYERARIAEYWVVDGAARVLQQFTLGAADRYRPAVASRERVECQVIAGVRIDLGPLWE